MTYEETMRFAKEDQCWKSGQNPFRNEEAWLEELNTGSNAPGLDNE